MILPSGWMSWTSVHIIVHRLPLSNLNFLNRFAARGFRCIIYWRQRKHSRTELQEQLEPIRWSVSYCGILEHSVIATQPNDLFLGNIEGWTESGRREDNYVRHEQGFRYSMLKRVLKLPGRYNDICAIWKRVSKWKFENTNTNMKWMNKRIVIPHIHLM